MSLSDSDRAKDILEVVPRAMRAIRTEFRGHARPDLTVPQFRVLLRLDRGLATNRDIAEFLGVAAPTASRMVATLVRRGLVTRAQSETGDARKVALTITAKGHAHVAGLRGRVQDVLAERLCRLPAAKKQTLTAGLRILAEIFPSHAEATPK